MLGRKKKLELLMQEFIVEAVLATSSRAKFVVSLRQERLTRVSLITSARGKLITSISRYYSLKGNQ